MESSLGWKVFTTLSIRQFRASRNESRTRALLGVDADVLVELRPPLRG